MQITFRTTEPNATAPVDRRTHIDLFACNFEGREVTIPPRGAASIQTGIVLQLPAGVVAHLVSLRSNGEACRLATGAALVKDDCDSPLELRMHNDTDVPFIVKHGDRLAHAIPVRIVDFQLSELAADPAPAGEQTAAAPKASSKKKGAKAAPAETESAAADPAPAGDWLDHKPGDTPAADAAADQPNTATE